MGSPKNNISAFIVFLVLLVLPSSGCDKIKEMVNAFKVDQATEAIKKNPKDAEAYSDRGWAYIKKGDYDRAIQDYSEAIKIKPDY